MNITDIDELKKGFPIDQLDVQVKKAFEPQEGEGQYGPWRIQAAIIKDASGEIRATFWNRFNLDLRNLEGEDIILESHADAKGKPFGLSVDEYNGKKQVKVSEKAGFEAVTGELPVDGSVPEFVPEHTGSETRMVPNFVGKAASKRFVSEETKRKSIEKQAALSAAISFVHGHEASNDLDGVISAANAFYKFLHDQPELSD